MIVSQNALKAATAFRRGMDTSQIAKMLMVSEAEAYRLVQAGTLLVPMQKGMAARFEQVLAEVKHYPPTRLK